MLSASIIPDSESRLIIRVGQKFSSGMFFSVRNLPSFLPAWLLGRLPDRQVAARSLRTLRALPTSSLTGQADSALVLFSSKADR